MATAIYLHGIFLAKIDKKETDEEKERVGIAVVLLALLPLTFDVVFLIGLFRLGK